jgi:F-type H+-transporting ATPase subunit c
MSGERGWIETGDGVILLSVDPKNKAKEKKMKRGLVTVVTSIASVLILAPLAIAAEAANPGAGVDYTKAIVVSMALLAAGLAIGLGTIGTGIGMGQGLSGATSAVGRNPEAQGRIMLTMMVGLAMIESLAIYALVIALVILYANPLLKVIGS